MTDPQDSIDQALQPTTPVAPPIVPPVVPPPLPELPVAPSVASVAVGDDTPLAFVTPPTVTPPETPIAPPVEPMSPPPSPLPVPPEEPPKKSGKGKIIGIVIGFFLLLAGLGGGFYFYSNYLPASPSTVAGVLVDAMTQADCHGCWNGGKLVWRGGSCKVSGTCDPNDIAVDAVKITRAKCDEAGGAWCDACGGFCNLSKDKGCHQLQIAYCGEYPTYGASLVDCDGKEAQKCNCPGQGDKCFDRTGYCGDEPGLSQQTRDTALCAAATLITNDTSTVTNYYYCPGKFTDVIKGCSIEGKPPNPSCYCGTVQVDGPNGFSTSTMKCGCDAKASEPPKITDYSLSCTGLTKDVAMPVVGSKITFTCAGSTVPAAGASLLRYTFRYNIDGGAWKDLANKTDSTAELTIAACGTYGVQCKACATYQGTTLCDPVWQGATAQ